MKNNKLLILMLIFFVIIGIVVLTNLLSFSKVDRLILSQIKENQLTETKYVAKQIESQITQVKDDLVTLTKFPKIESLDANKCKQNIKIVHEKIEGKIESLLRVDKEGNIIECSSPAFSSYIGLNIKNKDYFKIPKETNEPAISGVERQGTNSQIIVSAPLFETTEYTPYPNFKGQFKGLLLSIIDINSLYYSSIHQSFGSEKNFFLLINLNTEETILKSNDIGSYHEIKSKLPEATKNLDAILNIEPFGDAILTSSDISLGAEKWRLIVLTPLKNVNKEVESFKKSHIINLGLIIIVILGVFFLLISSYKSKEEAQSKLEKTNVTLENLGIKVEVEKDKYSQADLSLDAKKVYLVKEDDENHAHELFISCLNKGFAGLGITRNDPRVIKKKYNLQKTSFIWLTNIKVEGVACETNIDNLYELISEFIKKSKKSVVLIDRLDYILNENKFEEAIKKLHAIKDLAQTKDCIIILSANPSLIKESQIKAIEAETVDLYGKHLSKGIELSELELGALNYINEKNINNKLVSYKDITKNFNITKPTTRAKIKNLQKMGLIQVEQKGRFKSLKATSTGRRILSSR
ncbi:DUF835 domain-containing protein [Candidatus Woesearchaeota archaeon]|nr:DUF835 domain-containing protein [Candidatus Woesearchaeota archaeon]